MAMIEFSLIPDAETDFQTMVNVISTFKREMGIHVHLERMERGNAWSQRIGIATQGHGANISYVGSTWISSLMTINAQRPSPST